MNSVRRIFLIATAVFVLTFWFAPPSIAQWSPTIPPRQPFLPDRRTADELNKRVIELYGAGRYAEAIPLAQQALAIYENALGPDHPDVAWR